MIGISRKAGALHAPSTQKSPAYLAHFFRRDIDILCVEQELPRSEGKATYSFPWMYEHAAWKK
jgi:hypothetical protein